MPATHSTVAAARRRRANPAATVLACLLMLALGVLPVIARSSYDWGLPQGMPEPVVPPDNPMSDEKVQLGRHLFYDRRLSRDGSIACASCHQQERAFADPRRLPSGVDGQPGERNAMSLANVAYLPVLTWSNPMITSLEVQALIPLFGEHPVEMGMSGREQQLFEGLRTDPVYQRLFPLAFPEEARAGDARLYSLASLTRALASFQRSLISFDSPYDRYRYRGQSDAISVSARRGEALFFSERTECYHCHGGFNFTDNLVHRRQPLAETGFHNTGLYDLDARGTYPAGQTGLAAFTGARSDMGRFRTPSLRNVSVTAPYMHDGSIADLRAVIREHYAKAGRSANSAGRPSPLRSELMVGFELEAGELDDLIAFLSALTDERFLNDPRHADPWKKP